MYFLICCYVLEIWTSYACTKWPTTSPTLSPTSLTINPTKNPSPSPTPLVCKWKDANFIHKTLFLLFERKIYSECSRIMFVYRNWL